jgi:hypothetical protein
MVEPEAQRHANFLIQILFPFDRCMSVVRIVGREAPVGKGLLEEIDDLGRILNRDRVSLENGHTGVLRKLPSLSTQTIISMRVSNLARVKTRMLVKASCRRRL